MSLDPARQTFIFECRERLQSMEETLLALEINPKDRDAINTIFGDAHTIKGSSGIFGFNRVVRFAHVMESLLDKVRDEAVSVDGDLIALLLSCVDHLTMLAQQDIAGKEDAETSRNSLILIERLNRYLGLVESDVSPNASSGRRKLESPGVPVESELGVTHGGGPTVSSGAWHISLRFGLDILQNGMDPLSFIRYLRTLGTIVGMTMLDDALPEPDKMNPEFCYLGVEIDFRSDASKQTIEEAFLFLRESSTIRILPPYSRISDYVDLIDQLPEDKLYLGRLLIESGALTEHELAEGLEKQRSLQEVSARADIAQTKHALGEILVEQGVVQTEVVEAALDKQRHIKEGLTQEAALIRVQVKKLDLLVNLVGELVIANAGAINLAKGNGDGDLFEAILKVGRFVEEIRDSALHLRMVHIGETFNRFRRTVRDTSRDLGKEIELVITGGETELDKSIVDAIGDPLLHLVRNSIDHGIESVESRLRQGKPSKGTLSLNAFHESGSVVIEIADDGGGLNKERILHKAVSKGLVSPDQIPSDKELFNLIFEPGFSTAEQVTNLSGRGIGMDVVRRNVEALRGSIDIDSEEGVGTVVRIRLPLTLAIIKGFLIGLAKTTWVIPLDMISECVQLNDFDGSLANGRSYFDLRGELLPCLRLREEFDISGPGRNRENIVVVQFGEQRAGLVVDRLLGEFQTVIKPLGKIFQSLKGISGSTILGNGDVALILDVPALIERAKSRETRLMGRTAGVT